VFFLQDKSETQEVLKKFLRRAQKEFDANVKKIRSDNGTEFKNTQVEDFLDEEGIRHEFLAPYTPQQNGVAGRTVLSSRWQEPCLMNTRPQISFGWRRSTRRVMQLTTSTSTSS
jgi:transposase InsO family protein